MGNIYTDVLQVGVAMLIIIAIGWFLQFRGIVTAEEFNSCNSLCSKIGLPFLMFNTLVKQSIQDISFMPLVITILMNVSSHIILLLVFIFRKEDALEYYVTLEISSCYVNYVVIGMPIFISLWGEESEKVAVICPFAHYFFVVPLYMLLTNLIKIKKEKAEAAESGANQSEDIDIKVSITLKDVGLAFWHSIKTPLVLGAFIGLIWSCTTLTAPTFLTTLTNTIGDIVVVLSLLCIGSFLETNSIIACSWGTLLICLFVRFVFGPVVALGWCKALKVSGTLGKQCTVLSSMPVSTVAYILATSTGFGEAASSSMVFWTVILIVPLVMLWFYIFDATNVFPE